MAKKMGEDRVGCMCREEKVFWNHFKDIHFIRILKSGGFEQRLAMPEMFSKNCRNKLPEILTLRGPSGAEYEVSLATEDEKLFFEHGWEEFVKGHSLEENDRLVFKYKGVSHFDVLIFNSQDCEKVVPYDAQKHGHDEEHGSNPYVRREQKYFRTSSSSVGSNCNPKKSTKDDARSVQRTRVSQPATHKTKDGDQHANSSRYGKNSGLDKIPVSSGVAKAKSGVEQVAKQYSHRKREVSKRYSFQQKCKRRPVTDAEKKKTQLVADKALTKDGFKVIMRASHVYWRFRMELPREWVIAHLRPATRDLILRVKDKSWEVKLCYHEKTRAVATLVSGFREFVSENRLEEFDVCVFRPAACATARSAFVLDVKIFRVVDVVTRLALMAPPKLKLTSGELKRTG